MGRKYLFHDQKELYFVTFTIVNWVDVFIRDVYKNVFINSVVYCQENKGLQVYAWVVMTSHVHMIIGTDGKNNLSDIVRDLKSYTSKQIKIEIENNMQESRREWMIWMFERAGKKNSNNINWQFCHTFLRHIQWRWQND